MYKIVKKFKIIAIFIAFINTACLFGVSNMQAAEVTILYAKDFGAIADGSTNCTQAMNPYLQCPILLMK